MFVGDENTFQMEMYQGAGCKGEKMALQATEAESAKILARECGITNKNNLEKLKQLGTNKEKTLTINQLQDELGVFKKKAQEFHKKLQSLE